MAPPRGKGWLGQIGRNAQRLLGFLRSWLIYQSRPHRHSHLVRFYRPFVGPGDLCFDLGAHLGNHTRAWLELGARVVAVEPQPICMHWLQRCYADEVRVALVEKAIGTENGDVKMHVSRLHPTVSTTSTEWREVVQWETPFDHVRWQDRISVEMTTLDALMSSYGTPAFCKIDVEGAEWDVLRGCSRSLPALSFEYIPAAMETARRCLHRLRELGEYEFRWSVGEPLDFEGDRWLPPDQMSEVLACLAGSSSSGDIFARRRRQ